MTFITAVLPVLIYLCLVIAVIVFVCLAFSYRNEARFWQREANQRSLERHYRHELTASIRAASQHNPKLNGYGRPHKESTGSAGSQ
jgi:hypothetical protein